MVASFLIIGFSLVLLVYWFRYSCILLLRNAEQAVPEHAGLDIRFSFADVQARLKTAQDLDPLRLSLQRDYEVLTYLLQHAAGLSLESLEDRLLVLDYRVMQWWYRLTRTAAPEQARQAISEMATILGVLVQKMAEQAGVQNEV